MTVALLEVIAPQRLYYRDQRETFRQLEHLERDALRRILDRVEELRMEITDRLLAMPTTRNQDGTETWQAWQLQAYRHELEQAAQRWSARLSADLGRDLVSAGDLGKQQMGALSTLAQAQGVPAAVVSFGSMGILDEQVAASVLHSADYIKTVERQVISTVNRELQATIFGGQSRWDAVQHIRAALSTQQSRTGTAGQKRFGTLTYQAIRIERTELITIYNVVNEHAIRNAQEEVPGIMKEWVTILDSRADDPCRALSGKRVQPDATFPGGVTAPPLHVMCRCRVVAWHPSWPDDPFPVGTAH